MNQEFLKAAEDKMKASLQHFTEELAGLRSGRANTAMIDSIKVSVYGQDMPLKGIASISTPDAKTLQIQPWDASNMAAIEKAITENTTLAFTPNNDGHVIRINVPPMSEETRAQMVKVLHSKGEECNISLRNARHDALNDGKTAAKAKKITEDDITSLEKDLNTLIDKYQAQVTEISKNKETELLQT
jgi:ribosome recycling factor